MDTIIQVAFGVKVDSLIDNKNPVIINAKKTFSSDLSLLRVLKFMIAFAMPKYFGGLVRNSSFDYFEELAERIIAEKRKKYQNKDNLGKANNFIELLLESEAEAKSLDLNNNVNNEGKAVKCKF